MMLWADSFDHYGDDESKMTDGAWAEVGTGWSLDQTHVRTGAWGIKSAGGATSSLRRVFGAPYTSVGVGLAVFYTALPTGNAKSILHEFRDAANVAQISIVVESTGVLSIYRGTTAGSDGDLLASSTTLLTANSFNHVEAFVTIDDGAGGSVEVRLNEVTVVTFAGITAHTANIETSQWASYGKTLGSGGEHFVDDIFAWQADASSGFNDDFIGDKKVFTQFPDADVNESGKDDWIPSDTGAEMFEMVDDNPADEGTTITAENIGDRAAMTFPDVHPDTIEIRAIVLVHRTKKADAGTTFVQMAAENAGSEEPGLDRPMTTLFTYYHDVFEFDPDTAAPWTPSGANAMAAILERTA